MYTLRRITSDKIQTNTSLGGNYVLVLKEENPEEFKKTIKEWDKEYIEGCYGVVVFDDGQGIMPLYDKSEYYVMCSNGQTLDNISKKK